MHQCIYVSRIAENMVLIEAKSWTLVSVAGETHLGFGHVIFPRAIEEFWNSHEEHAWEISVTIGDAMKPPSFAHLGRLGSPTSSSLFLPWSPPLPPLPGTEPRAHASTTTPYPALLFEIKSRHCVL